MFCAWIHFHVPNCIQLSIAYFKLPNAAASDDWYLANAKMVGFYRVNYEDDNWQRLLDQAATDPGVWCLHRYYNPQKFDTTKIDNVKSMTCLVNTCFKCQRYTIWTMLCETVEPWSFNTNYYNIGESWGIYYTMPNLGRGYPPPTFPYFNTLFSPRTEVPPYPRKISFRFQVHIKTQWGYTTQIWAPNNVPFLPAWKLLQEWWQSQSLQITTRTVILRVRPSLLDSLYYTVRMTSSSL